MKADLLTGLGDRHAFLSRGESQVRDGRSFALAVLNVDRLKRFNAHNGHEAGDAVLRAIAEQLRPWVSFRIGGDSFAVLLADVVEADEIRRRVADHVNPSQPDHCGDEHCMGVAPPPRVSIGVSLWQEGSFGALLERAEAALHRAKCNGRDRVEIA